MCLGNDTSHTRLADFSERIEAGLVCILFKEVALQLL